MGGESSTLSWVDVTASTRGQKAGCDRAGWSVPMHTSIDRRVAVCLFALPRRRTELVRQVVQIVIEEVMDSGHVVFVEFAGRSERRIVRCFEEIVEDPRDRAGCCLKNAFAFFEGQVLRSEVCAMCAQEMPFAGLGPAEVACIKCSLLDSPSFRTKKRLRCLDDLASVVHDSRDVLNQQGRSAGHLSDRWDECVEKVSGIVSSGVVVQVGVPLTRGTSDH